MSRPALSCWLLVLGALVTGCKGGQDQISPARGGQRGARSAQGGGRDTKARASSGAVRVPTEIQGVHFRIDPSVVLEVRRLHGALVPTREGQPPGFDDPGSFVIEIDGAEVAMTPASMAAAMNRYAFGYPGAPVENIDIQIRDGHLVQSATIKKAIPVHTTLEGDLAATPEGDVLFHPTKIKAGGVPVKGLLGLFDVELAETIKMRKGRGLEIRDNDFLLDPERLLPAPRIRGRVTGVRIERDRIVQIFGEGPEGGSLKPSFPEAENYIFHRGGDLLIGKLTMHDADLQLIDADPSDPFEFFLSRYLDQLVAGYSRTLPDKGLVTYMPDFNDVQEGKISPE